MSKRTLVFVLVVPLIVVGVGYALYFSTVTVDPSAPVFEATPSSETFASEESRVLPDGWAEYRNAAYRFSLYYPNTLFVKERDEGGGAMTVTFQNTQNPAGFQVFIVPYGPSQVTEQRFRRDVPSGVRESVVSVSVHGALGAAFYSRDVSLGDTYEIWFIRDGYLYEVTTLKPLENDLRQVMDTWRFSR